MHIELPNIYIVRHAETLWSLTRQHTSHTDLPLTERGECNARLLKKRLKNITFVKVFTSPLQRAARTCELAGFGKIAEIDSDLVEWNCGEYEGLRFEEIRALRPGWDIFSDGCPGGESPVEVIKRADRMVEKLHRVNGNVLIFSSGHFIKVLAIRWLGLESLISCGYFMLNTASLSVLGYKYDAQPVILLWNDDHHVQSSKCS